MKALQLLIVTFALAWVCTVTSSAYDHARETADRIAQAAGIAAWPAIESIAFTFNVERDGKTTSRSWLWKPRIGEVTAVEERVIYSQSAVPEEHKKLDAHFINDKYWLLFPFHLVWDTSATLTLADEHALAPFPELPMLKLTVQYPDEGGYTPGDAYDLFYDDRFVVQSWIFWKGGKGDGSAASWDNYKEYGGLNIATEHKLKGGGRLFFTEISVKNVD